MAHTSFLVVGTVKELKENRIDPAHEGSCAAPVVENGRVVVRGCPFYNGYRLKENDAMSPFVECPLKAGNDYDGKEHRGEGPFGCGVREAKMAIGASGRRYAQPAVKTRWCFDIPLADAQLRINGGALRVEALEGEKFPMIVDQRKEEVVPMQGPTVTFTPVLNEEYVVPKFPRLGTGRNLQGNEAAVLLGGLKGSGTMVDEREKKEREGVMDAAFGPRPKRG